MKAVYLRVRMGLALFFLIGAIHAVAQADLVGNIATQMAFFPIQQTPSREAHPAMIDLELLVQANLTLSGLTIGTKTAVGLTGPEHTIVTFKSLLGATLFQAEAWFAAPFQTAVIPGDITGGTFSYPICTAPPDVNGWCPKDIMFVKKRVITSLNVGGVQLENLAMFEDVTFPDPDIKYMGTILESLDPLSGMLLTTVTNPSSHYQTQSFRFGDIISVSGQTVSGIQLESKTGLCASNDPNKIKKHVALGKVCQTAVQNFAFETVSIQNVIFANASLDASLTLDTDRLFSVDVASQLNLFGLATLDINFRSHSPSHADQPVLSGSLNGPFFKLQFNDVGADLLPDSFQLFVETILNGVQNPITVSSLTMFQPQSGVSEHVLTVALKGGNFNFQADTTWEGTNQLTWRETSLSLDWQVGGFQLQAGAVIEPIIMGVRKVHTKFSFDF